MDDTLYEELQFVNSGFSRVADHLSKKHGVKKNEILRVLKEDFKRGLRKRNFNVMLKKLKIDDDKFL